LDYLEELEQTEKKGYELLERHPVKEKSEERIPNMNNT